MREESKKVLSNQGERVLKASGHFTESNDNGSIVKKLKAEIKEQESKVVQLESEIVDLKKTKNSNADRGLIPKPPSASGTRNEWKIRRPYGR